MRKAIYALIGGLVVASCIVPNYEVDDSVGDGSDDGPGGESGTSTGGSSTGGDSNGGVSTGGSARGGTSGQGGAGGQGGDEATGGTSGQGGTAGQGGAPTGGTAGDAGAGTGGCAMDLTDCDGECFNLETDAEHCGDCDTDCATGEVCFEGSCELDCGTLTQCGTSCVDTDTDEMHCGDCDTPCLGTCVGGDCDLSCPDNRLRCGANCCALPPANGTVDCQSNSCVFGCATNYNDCNADPAVTECYARTDVAHCGTNCLDCRQPNAMAACTGSVCSNTCIGEALPCAPTNGKPACGTWDFESGTTEGWSLVAEPDTAADSELTTRTATFSTGTRSLAIHFNGNGSSRAIIKLKLRLCESGQAINLQNKVLQLDIRSITDTGTGGYEWVNGPNYFSLYNGSTLVTSTGDFNMASDDVWQTGSNQISMDTPVITDIVFWFRVYEAWTGWVYIDNVRIVQCNSTLCP
jgi:hypothetical protein